MRHMDLLACVLAPLGLDTPLPYKTTPVPHHRRVRQGEPGQWGRKLSE